MKLDPGFPTHWKTERLIDELGAEGVLALLRLWGKCQINREWKGLELTPKRLAMETKWKGDANHLFRIFTDPDAAWLDKEEGGTYALHGFEEHQKQVIHLWSAGAKGGRPRKVSLTLSSKEEDTSSSSSSYPICKANGNHMVSEVRPPKFSEVQKFASGQPFPISEECTDAFFDEMESLQWTYKGQPCIVTNAWQARFRRYATNWINNRNSPQGKAVAR